MNGMDSKTIIAVCALMTVLFGIIQLSVWPLKGRMDRIENKLVHIEDKLDKVLSIPQAQKK